MASYNHGLSKDGLCYVGEEKLLFGQCGPDKCVHLTEVMEYCADYVMELYTQRGQNRDFLSEKGYAQMVSRASFHINRLPKENEEIVITVREEKPDRIQLMRSYDFKTKAGEQLITAKSLWVIVNPQTRDVVMPDKFEFLAKSELQTELEKKPGKIRIPEQLEALGEQKILYSHIDGNGHLTNAKYINFALDFLPENFQSKQLKDFRLNFCKEIRKDEIMKIFGAFDAEQNRFVVVGKKDEDGNLISSFECELFY